MVHSNSRFATFYIRDAMNLINRLQRLSTFAFGVCLLVLSPAVLQAQILDPVAWSFSVHETEKSNQVNLVFHADIEPCWHIYSQFLDDPNGPLPTYFELELPDGVEAIGAIEECEPTVEYDPNFMMDLKFFEEEVNWVQTIQINGDVDEAVKGYLSFMVCDDSRCLPPEDIDFEFDLNANPAQALENRCPPSKHLCHGDSGLDMSKPDGILEPVTWSTSIYKTDKSDEYELIFQASVESCWHIYSQFIEGFDGPMATAFGVDWPEGLEPMGDVQECKPIVKFDPQFNMDVPYFEEEVFFVQRFSASRAAESTVSGFITYMACNEERCVFPPDLNFKVSLADLSHASEIDDRPESCPDLQHLCGGIDSSDASTNSEEEEEGLLGVFLLGMLLGFAALLTPCVFPMIPMTVSFFTKQSKTRSEGIRNALIYGFFIIFIYTGLGLLLTAIFGVDILNVISTAPFFNVFLFLLLLIFGASFLGAFEIQLPTSWANKTDEAADKGGLIGIFFMAATLAIVSFSCTGPLIGSALAGAATGSYAAPTAVMFGFSLALALPFMLFSAFPGWLNSLPQSGGWLNSVKVVLGLLEIGFAFKFLSNADLVLQLGLLQRELFIAIWVAIVLCIAFYLFGWILFPHDSKTERIGVFRFSMGMIFLTLGIYLVPGMWGAPVKLISGFPPPMFYSEWSQGSTNNEGHSTGHVEARFTDYEEGMAAAIAEGKPLALDFTGWACVNCRKMEEQVWSDSGVAEILENDVVLVSLYVDERKALPENEQDEEVYGGKAFKIKTVGNKWSYLQASRFNTNSQPFYVLLDHDGQPLSEGVGYDPDPEKFIAFLDKGIQKFKE
ncbi:MAG: thiol:disulfide interchange protein [Crocinitomicaceae bacterium]|nr:thiol:disulfide interchange protein [Crocinitomicaceae bacterium]